jgi:hypothetical protein
VIRIRHLTLPAGLSAVVLRDSKGGVQVFVSDTLDADQQRAAVRLALRSIYRPAWRAGLLPIPVGLLLGNFRRIVVWTARAVRTHAVASSAAAFLLAAGAAALIVGLPQHHGPVVAGHAPHRSQLQVPAAGRTHSAGKHRAGHSTLPAPRATAVAARSTGTPPGRITPTPAPRSASPSASQSATPEPSKSAAPLPSGTPSPTQPAPSPSPSPPPSGGGTCVVILGIWICL